MSSKKCESQTSSLEIISSFIISHPNEWSQNPEYIDGKETANNLKEPW